MGWSMSWTAAGRSNTLEMELEILVILGVEAAEEDGWLVQYEPDLSGVVELSERRRPLLAILYVGYVYARESHFLHWDDWA